VRFNADDGEELALWSFFALFGGAGVVRVERRGIALFGWFWDAFRRIRGLFSAFSRLPAERPPRMAVVRVWRGVGRPSGGLRGRGLGPTMVSTPCASHLTRGTCALTSVR